MTTGFSYDGSFPGTIGFVQQIAEMAVVPATDPAFLAILPAAITYAENRLCRDLDFLSTVGANATYALTPGSRSAAIPVGLFVTLQQVNLLTPAGATLPDSSVRNPLTPVTKEFLDVVFGDPSATGLPTMFAMFNQSTILVGPWPDAAYTVEAVGTTRPASLSVSNPTTFISLYLPDLMLMAAMVYISAYQRNFTGASANDPAMPGTYEAQYQTLLKGAMVEEARKKFQSSGWASMSPAQVASPSRG